jgi:hypothetical protein
MKSVSKIECDHSLLWSNYERLQKEITEIKYDISHILYHLKLQRGEMTTRFVPVPKPMTLWKRLKCALKGQRY